MMLCDHDSIIHDTITIESVIGSMVIFLGRKIIFLGDGFPQIHMLY